VYDLNCTLEGQTFCPQGIWPNTLEHKELYMIVIDNFLNDDLYGEMLTDASFFPQSMGSEERIATELNSYHYEQSSCYAPYMFWDGWWRSPANTLKKRIVQAIWENRLTVPQEQIVGFEYWTRTFLPGQYLDVHVDEDTFMYEESKTFQGPLDGCILYGVDNLEGGFVELHSAHSPLVDGSIGALERESIDSAQVNIEHRERIAYRGNRLVMFDSGHVLHATTPAKSGIRQVLVVNVWHKDVPPTALKKGTFYYE
jgi:hypothetical protein